MNSLPTYEINGNIITFTNPKMVTDGGCMCNETFIEIDTDKMSQPLLMELMFHLGEGNIYLKTIKANK